ncbi:MAG: sigma 54-interacting transcriptional regulator [Myxococcota bacterium]|nr:sigma 54-interacting transcriptional regulator [Myxococcota bacterium]
MGYLVIDLPNGESKTVKIFRPLTTIGRASDNDVVLKDSGLQTTHAHVTKANQQYSITGMLRDMTVNGRRQKSSRLSDGDIVRLGDISMKFFAAEPPKPNTRSPLPAVPGQPQLKTTESRSAYRRIHEFSLKVLANDSTNSLVEAILDSVIDLTGAGKGFLVLLDPEGQPRVSCARNIARESLPSELADLSDSILQKVIASRKPIIVADAMSNQEFNASVSVMSLQLHSVMCCPLIDREELKGVLYLGNNRVADVFDDAALDTLTVFAAQASLLIGQAERREELTAALNRLEAQLNDTRDGQIIGASDAMETVMKRVRKVAPADISVLITGETGTGKELIARKIHEDSPRNRGPLVVINCGAIPANLLESELFGHVKGAFTGAIADKQGHFAAAAGGTLFLDEIGEMEISLQVKLLRAIQEKVITPVGGSKPIAVDIRVVSATHKNLPKLIQEGLFREDLFYRLNVVNIHLPPLRERGQDIELIARYFLGKAKREVGSSVKGLSKAGLAAVKKYSWPGNIRELENRIRKAVVLTDSNLITAEDLDLDPSDIEEIVPLSIAKERFQIRYIARVLQRNGGNRTQTAKDLGVDARTIFRYLKKINDPLPDEDDKLGLESE